MDAAFRRLVAEARGCGDLYFAGLLPENRIEAAFGATRAVWRGWVYTPAVTVWVFLAQCLSADHSCREAVAQLIAWRVGRGQRPCSARTGRYCTTRDAIPEAVCAQLMRDAGCQVDEQAPSAWRWHGRRVLCVDGSTLTMPDTPANQAAYPQNPKQKPGCGFPIARIVVVFSLAVGTVLEAAIGRYQGKQTGENSLFRTLQGMLQEGDVVLADRYDSGWFDLALLVRRGGDVVVRKHQARRTDFRTGRRLGRHDHLVCWKKPQRPEWMDAETYAALPDELTVREVRVEVAQKGFRTRQLVVVTSLLDPAAFPAADLAALDRRRWQAELDLRSLKIVLPMDHLRCKTPHRVRNEFWRHLLADNLIRQVMAAAACAAGTQPYTISFKGALQTFNTLLPLLHTNLSPADWCRALLTAVATHVVADRPDRYEPRVRKRRPKNYKLMQKPRSEYKRHAA